MGENVFLFLFLFGHALGDFYLQSKNTVNKKERQRLYVIQHAAVYTACLMVVILLAYQFNLALFGFMLLLFVAHTIIDLAKRKAEKATNLPVLPQKTKRECLFFIDQGLHLVSIIVLSALFCEHVIARPWFSSLTPLKLGWEVHPIMLLTGLAYIIKPASMVIERIMRVCGIQLTTDTGFSNGGKVIGILERLLIYFLLLLGQFSTIGLVIAAKSLARFRDLDDRQCAEYYIIGTFLSLVAVGAVALIAIIL